jgi:hypothetical protein
MKRDLLDDDWDWDENDFIEDEDDYDSDEEPEVIMVKTFNSENQAHIYAAALGNEGINAQVVGNTTSAMTPFDYGNVRLYVASSQSQKAVAFIKQLDAENALREKPEISAAAILAIIVVALFVLSILFRMIQMVVRGDI